MGDDAMRAAILVALVACSSSGTPDDTPSACTQTNMCRAAKDLADAECGVRYACDPTYQEDSATCYAAELERLCLSGKAEQICEAPSCQLENNYEQCLAAQAQCDDPAACIPEPGAECTP